jgi:pSer/pThr/pTyr-binding forkhead associated (FHA) protein
LTFLAEFKYESRTYNIIDIPKPKFSYVMLQIHNADKNKERGIYLIQLKNKDFIKIVNNLLIVQGRVQECDIKLNDISVSRHHATIHIKNTSLQIVDNKSKFGTLVQVRK